MKTREVSEVFYYRENEKKSKLFSDLKDAIRFRDSLKLNHRKYGGRRKVTVTEVA